MVEVKCRVEQGCKEGWRHAHSEQMTASDMKMSVKYTKRELGNTAAEFRRQKIVSKRRRADKAHIHCLYSVQNS